MYEDTIGVKTLVYQNQLPCHKILHKCFITDLKNVAEILFFQLSPVIKSNVPCVSRYDRRSG